MQDAYMDFAEEWEANHEPMTPYAARLRGHSYEEWLEDCWKRETQVVGGFVTAHTYFWVDETGVIVGAVNLRHSLNDHLLRVGGHIGYGVRPSARRQGHAKAMLAATLPKAKALGLSRVLITCDKTNVGSARTIQLNGGVLENEVEDDGHIKQRYWIEL